MSQTPSAESRLVTPAWLEANRDNPNIRLIEIAGSGQEDMAAYKAGHVPGAICWDWQKMLWDSHNRDFPDRDEFARRLGAAGIGNDTTVVFYGEDIQFGTYAWWTFTYCGHRDTRMLDGGRRRWVADGLPLTTDVPAPVASVAYTPNDRNETMRVLRDEMMRVVEAGATTILDARSPEEYRGERVGAPGTPDVGALRYGRIPGARHIFYLDLFDDTRSFKSPEELLPQLQALGAVPEDEIVAYCRMSHRATALYFVLTQRLGFEHVRIYDGSWTEWGNLVGAPIER